MNTFLGKKVAVKPQSKVTPIELFKNKSIVNQATPAVDPDLDVSNVSSDDVLSFISQQTSFIPIKQDDSLPSSQNTLEFLLKEIIKKAVEEVIEEKMTVIIEKIIEKKDIFNSRLK